MITYLWTKNDNSGYIGLDGTVYDGAPTAEEIVSLQQYSQRYVNDEEGYRTAFDSNVAPKLGISNPYAYRQYYNTDDSCLPDICQVNASVVNDGGDTKVETKIYTADTGCRVLDFTFYNLCGDCMATAGSQNVYVRYTNQDCIDNNGGQYPPRSCMFTEAAGHNVVGFLITDNPDDATDPSKYAWFQVGGCGDDAQSYISYVFARSTTKPETPKGGTYETGVPDTPAGVWFDAPHGRNNYPIWMSKRTFWSDEDTVIEHSNLPWSEPACMSDSKTFQTEWAEETTQTTAVYLKLKTLPNLNDFPDPNNITEGIDEEAWRAAASAAGCGMWSDDAEGATYMAWANCRNGNWDDWTVARIRGEAGEDGVNAGRTFMIFASLPEKDENENDIVPEAPTGGLWDIENNVLLRNANPPLVGIDNMGRSVEWTPDNNSVRGNITWLSVGTFDGEYGRLITPPGWSEPVRITGANGQDGVDGENIEFIFARFEDVSAFTEYYDIATDTKSEECAQMLAAREIEYSKKGTPWEERDYIPYYSSWRYEWFDHPNGIGEDDNMVFWKVEACCMRQKIQNPENPEDPTDMIWTDWVGPFIWASWGEDGIDGDGVEYIFCVTTKANRTCRWKPITSDKMTEEDIASAVSFPTLPDLENFSDNECDDMPDFVHVDGEDETLYHIKDTVFLFPEEPFGIMPPQNFNDNEDGDCVRAEGDCNYCTDSLYKTLCYGEDEYDLKKKILWEFYQESEFVPSNDRIKEEFNDPESALHKILERNDALGRADVWYDFLYGWDANWTDNPLDVGPQQPYEWVSIRKYKRGADEEDELNKEWQVFSEPKLWANWAFDGTATYTSMVFTRTNDDISGMELCGGTMELPYPGAGSSGDTEFDSGCTTSSYDAFKKRSEVKYECPECSGETKTYYWYDTVPSDASYFYEKLDLSELSDEDRQAVEAEAVAVANDKWPNPDDLTEKSPVYIAYTEDDLTTGYYIKKSHSRGECIWISTRIFGDYITGENQGWSSPRRMSDSSDFNVEWCLTNLTQAQIDELKSSRMNFGVFVKEIEENDIIDDDIHSEAEALFEKRAAEFRSDACPEGLGVWSDKGDGAIYMATTTCRNGRWTNWTVSKIKGEKGDTGIGITLYGATKGAVKEYDDLITCVEENTELQPGDIWLVWDCNSSDIPCIDDPTLEAHAGMQFFEYVSPRKWDCLSCRLKYEYVVASEGEFIILSEEHPELVDTVELLPTSATEDSTYMIHVTGTTENPDNSYYLLQSSRFVNEGTTIILAGITEKAEGCQVSAATQLYDRLGIMNGDFFVWDTDSWRNVTNLMGPGSFVHVKYAKMHAGHRYILTDPTDDANPGETPGKYMGMYVDDTKGDQEGKEYYNSITGEHYWYINDESTPAMEDGGPGRYKWTKVVGDDGLGYEFIYMTTESDEEVAAGGSYTNGRPYVPYFSEEFMSEPDGLYQQDGFVPKAIVRDRKTGRNVDLRSQAYVGKAFVMNTYTADWDDNPITCDIDDRFRWKCYRVKSGGIWGPFIGDGSSSSSTYTNGKYATFDANYAVDGESIVIGDFDNDTVAIGCTDSGYTAENLIFEMTPLLYKGSTAYTVTSCTAVEATLPSSCFTFNAATQKLSINVPLGTLVIPALKLTFEISGYREDTGVEEHAQATAMVIGIKGNVIYSLVPSKGTIKKDGQGNVMDDLPLNCNVVKRVVGSTTYEEISPIEANDEYRIWYEAYMFSTSDSTQTRVDSGWFSNSMFDTKQEQKSIKEKVVFKLYTRANKIYGWAAQPNENSVLNDVETVYVVSDGEMGASPFLADLDNELDSIPLTYDGIVDGDNYDPESSEVTYVTASTRVSLYYGSREIEIDGITATTGTTQDAPGAKTLNETDKPLDTAGNILARKDNTNLITISVRNGWDGFPTDPLEIRIFVKGDNDRGEETLNKLTFTLAGIKAGKEGEHATLYSLLPSVSSIRRQSNGGKDPTAISCQVLKKTGKEVLTLSVNDLDAENLKIRYCTDDSISYEHDFDGTIPTNDIDKFIRFALVAKTAVTISTNNLYDLETVPVVKDGLDGTSPFILDIDNELDSVPLTYAGVVDGGGTAVTARTTTSLFYGNRRATITGWSASTETTLESSTELIAGDEVNLDTGGNIKVGLDSDRNGIITVKVADGWSGFPSDPLEIRIFVSGTTGNGQETLSRATFTLAGVKAGKEGETATIYTIQPASSFMVKDDDGTIRPNPLACSVIKKTGRSVADLSLSALDDEGLKIVWCQDDDPSYSHNYTEPIPTGNINKQVKFALIPKTASSASNSNMYDRETVPLVKNGEAGRGIIAMCNYWCATDCSATTVTGFPDKANIGSSPTGWTRNGSYYEEDDDKRNPPRQATGTIPIPTDEYPYLWKWEKTWYSGDGNNTFETNPALVCSIGDGVERIETWYIIREKTDDNITDVHTRYNRVVNGTDPEAAGFTILSGTTEPRELTAGTEAGEALWEFQRVIFSQKNPLCLGIQIVREYYQALKDVEVLRNMFGEANVQGKPGAYLREFLGVMSPKSGQQTIPDDEEEFFNSQVAAFMNATNHWKNDTDPYKHRIMFASGVQDLGGLNNSDMDETPIDITKFKATTTIWEGGLLECKKADIQGSIHAYSGSFGGDPNDPDKPGFCEIDWDGLHGYRTAGNGKVEMFKLTEDGVFIGATGDTVQLTPSGITGVSNGGDTIFSMSGSGVKIGASGDTVTLDTVNGLVGKQGNDTIFSVNSTGVKIGKSGDTVTLDTTNGLVGTKSGETIFSVGQDGVQFKNDSGNVELTTDGLYGYRTVNGVLTTAFTVNSSGASFGVDGDAIKIGTNGITGYTNNNVPIFKLNGSGLDIGSSGDTINLSLTGLTGYKMVGNERVESFSVNSGGASFGTSGDTVQLTPSGLIGRGASGDFFSLTSDGVNIGGSGDTINISRNGISGKTASGTTLFQLDGNGLLANKGTFNGVVNASELYVSTSGTTAGTRYESEFFINGTGQFGLNVLQQTSGRTATTIQTQFSPTIYRQEIPGQSCEISGGNLELKRSAGSYGDGVAYATLSPGGLTLKNTDEDTNTGLTSLDYYKLKFYDTLQGLDCQFGLTGITISEIAGYRGTVMTNRTLDIKYSGKATHLEEGRITCSAATPSHSVQIVGDSGKIFVTEGFYETSDARMKNVGEPLTGVLDKLSSIPTINYTWKDKEKDKDNHIGTLAQDVMTVFPELVSGSEEDSYTVDYAKLSVIAIAAIKELKAEVDELSKEIKRLKGSR